MKKNFAKVFGLVIVLLVFSSCQKDHDLVSAYQINIGDKEAPVLKPMGNNFGKRVNTGVSKLVKGFK